jgi:hypothetical protein
VKTAGEPDAPKGASPVRTGGISSNAPGLPGHIGHVFLVLTMCAQGPFRHGSGIGPRKLARSTRQRGEQMTWDQWPGSYLKESWSLVR